LASLILLLQLEKMTLEVSSLRVQLCDRERELADLRVLHDGAAKRCGEMESKIAKICNG
jgi:hypothetical protein